MAQTNQNKLYYGDNLEILRKYIQNESVDLIYLDPPFNSNRNYNVLFKDESGLESQAQLLAFEDTWHWDKNAEATYQYLVTKTSPNVAKMIGALREFIGTNQMMAYIVMMTVRLAELHRVLKKSGSLYLHCDPTASHYLKIVLDTIFSVGNFRNEIVWKRASAHNDSKRYGNIHDVLLFYSKSNVYTWNTQYTPYKEEYIKSEWRELPSKRMYKCENMLDPRGEMEEYDFMGTAAHWRTNHEGMMKFWNAPQTEVPNSHGRIKLGENGKPIKRCRIIFLDEMPGVPLQTWWDDIFSLRGGASERLGYPTQKPVTLLERIISASSNDGDVVLDPFAGCGTAIVAAQKLNRSWIGIDITHLSISLLKYRLKNFDLLPKKHYEVIGEPKDLTSAQQLAQDDRYQFQWWALSLVEGQPLHDKKKGKDKGIDGIITFTDDASQQVKKVLIQVKSGKVKSGDVRDLAGTMEREKAAIGVFITLEEPTKDMQVEAVAAGFYSSSGWKKDYPKIQILTVKALLEGLQIQMPPTQSTFQIKEDKFEKRTSQQKLWEDS